MTTDASGSKTLVNEARKAAASGDWASARRHYEELLRRFPGEVAHAYSLADAYQRLGLKAEAIRTYQWIAGQFAAKGELLRAIAALQGILKIDPDHAETGAALADLFAKRKAAGAPTPGAAAKTPSRPPAPKPAPPPPAERESDVLTLPDDHLQPLVAAAEAGEPMRRLKGPGTAPPGFPHAIPTRYTQVPLFSSLSTRVFVDVIGKVKVHPVSDDTVIVRQGEPGDAIFAVSEGKVRVSKEIASGATLELALLPAGSFFGEMALLTGGPRRATVTSVGNAEILEIPKAALEQISQEAPTVAETLRRFCRERLLQTALATGVLFRNLPSAERDQLVHRFRTLDAKPGTTILKEGYQADGLYVLVDGAAEVRKDVDRGKPRRLAMLHGGDFCGEMSLLSGGIAAASVVITEHATLLKLPRQTCDEVFQARPELLETIRGVAEERRRLNAQILSGALQGASGHSPA